MTNAVAIKQLSLPFTISYVDLASYTCVRKVADDELFFLQSDILLWYIQGVVITRQDY